MCIVSWLSLGFTLADKGYPGPVGKVWLDPLLNLCWGLSVALTAGGGGKGRMGSVPRLRPQALDGHCHQCFFFFF